MPRLHSKLFFGIATLLAAGAGLPSTASAQGIELYIDEGAPVYDYREYTPPPRRDYEERLGYGESCSPRRALRAARHLGLSDVEIAREGRRRVMVDGYDDDARENVRLVFANEPGCPLIDRY